GAVAFKPSSRPASVPGVKLVVSGGAGEWGSKLMVGATTTGDTSIAPVAANFGTVAVGATADQTFTVTNNAATAIRDLHTSAIAESSGVWSAPSMTCTTE